MESTQPTGNKSPGNECDRLTGDLITFMRVVSVIYALSLSSENYANHKQDGDINFHSYWKNIRE